MDSINKNICCIKNNFFASNTYLITTGVTNEGLIVDPGLDREGIEKEILLRKMKPLAILATHGHFDHIGSVKYFQTKYQIPYYLHEKDLKLAKSANFYLKIAKVEKKIDFAVPDFLFKKEEESVTIGLFNVNVFNFPGHSEGSCIFEFGEDIFSGDILYKKGLGFNNFPGENKFKLSLSIKNIFNKFNGNCNFYPGHGDAVLLNDIRCKNVDLINFLNN